MKALFTIITLLILTSCSSIKNKSIEECTETKVNNYTDIIESKFESVIGKDTLLFNEIQYKCVVTSFYIKKIMYDTFGKWNQAIYPNNQTHPILLWNNVKLFPNDSLLYTIAARGDEGLASNKKYIYTSFLAFNEKNEDLLAPDSQYKEKLITYFSKKIKENHTHNKKFYDVYWQEVKNNDKEKRKSSITNAFTSGVEVIEIKKNKTYKTPKSILFVFEGDTHLVHHYNDLKKHIKKRFRKQKIAFNYNLNSTKLLLTDLKEIPTKKNYPKDYEIVCTFSIGNFGGESNTNPYKSTQIHDLTAILKNTQNNEEVLKLVLKVKTFFTIATQNKAASEQLFKQIIKE
ncbi:hypothetical protein T190115A13A_300016 [Tenacibaculum sp. 190524A02b]|uniref:Lipoprotein n=1 Tax=Tenacibaculum vairaonense TaxID=3137860 RepID=A0ABM9PN27_9FLAO